MNKIIYDGVTTERVTLKVRGIPLGISRCIVNTLRPTVKVEIRVSVCLADNRIAFNALFSSDLKSRNRTIKLRGMYSLPNKAILKAGVSILGDSDR